MHEAAGTGRGLARARADCLNGQRGKAYVEISLINMYAKRGSLDDARAELVGLNWQAESILNTLHAFHLLLSLLAFAKALLALQFLGFRRRWTRRPARTMSGYPEVREVKLWGDKREREMYDNFADLFAIIRTTEKLEKAYVLDVINAKEYEPACTKLIAQFRTLKSTLRDTVPNVERFMETYKMDCPAALNCLLVSGMPANVENKSTSFRRGFEPQCVSGL